MMFSIIVPTYNRVHELQELIPSIEDQLIDQAKFELIIVDDGSTDNTKAYIESLDSKINISYYSQKNQGPGAARNLGMSKASGTYFIFVDSDCIIPKDYLQKTTSFINEHQPDAFGGPDTYHPSFSPLLKAINYSMTSFLGTGGTRGSKKSVAKYYPRSFNMGFHRKVFETIGGFGSLRHGQDMDYSARIYEAGFSVNLIHDNPVFHKRRTSLKKFFKQIFNWGIARINLSSIHEGFLKPIHLAPAFIVLVTFLISILSLLKIIPVELFYLIFIGVGLIALIAFMQSFAMYRSLKISFLSIVTLFLQVAAYGLGSLSGLFQYYILGKKETKGFVKNYYK